MPHGPAFAIIPRMTNGPSKVSTDSNADPAETPGSKHRPGHWLRTDSRFVTAALCIALLTFLTYLPSLWCGFVNWDDGAYVYENPDLRSLDLSFIQWSLTALVSHNWYPLTVISFAIDYSFWGLNPMGYHLTNTLLHTTNTLLVFFLAARLVNTGTTTGSNKNGSGEPSYSTEALTAAAITALLFGTHPIHVESVVWVTERKDVLYSLFFLLSIIFYLRYVRSVSKRALYYALTLAAFTFSLMSKPMAVTLPMVLLILDYYPLQRAGELKRVVLEKLPLFALSLASSVITIASQHGEGAMMSLTSLSVAERLLVAARGYALYLYKMIIPTGLAPFHPIPGRIEALMPEFAGPILLFIALTALSVVFIRKHKLFCATWFFYVITLLPVIGLLQSGAQAAAYRFTYIPLLGPFLLLALGVSVLYKKSAAGLRQGLLLTTAALIVLLTMKTTSQIQVWKNSITLWTYQVALYGERGDYVGLNNLGLAYDELGLDELAAVQFRRAVGARPEMAGPANNLGNSYFKLGRLKDAQAAFEEALRLDPDYPEAHYNLALMAMKRGETDRAASLLKEAIRLDPDYPDPHNNLATLYMGLGRIIEAELELKEALRINPDYSDARSNLGTLYARQGRFDDSIREFTEAVRTSPANARFRLNLELAYKKKQLAEEGAGVEREVRDDKDGPEQSSSRDAERRQQ